MSFSRDPESSGREVISDERFMKLTLPPQFVPGHLEDLEDALIQRSPDYTLSEHGKEKETKVQKDCKLRSQLKDNEAFLSCSILVHGATMSASSDPQNNGSEVNSDEGFMRIPLSPQFVPGCLEALEDALEVNSDAGLMRIPLPPQFVPGCLEVLEDALEVNSDAGFMRIPLPPHFVPECLEDLEDALMCLNFPPAYKIDESKDNCSDNSGGENPTDFNDRHRSGRDHSDNHSHEKHANDVYSNGYGEYGQGIAEKALRRD
ncbi:uncharacterized protein LOC123239883 [Gracilinanus agilis]|uniref:uncharacterized protein LOC123239883 n=1 Tax=Gracilinanus agilis TaxID=191870 RepID=UPI001CFCFC8B|nr:uncharacterized protein LOC123239883 [Gracilinanus agilis]